MGTNAMLTRAEVLDGFFLETRCMLLEIAATLDRHDRAPQGEAAPAGDERRDTIYEGLALLADRAAKADRTQRLLNLFSDLD